MQDMNINELTPEISVGGNDEAVIASENAVQYAGFFTRFAAFCIDSFVAGMLLLVVRIPMLVDVLGGSNGLLSTKVLFEFTAWDIVIYLLTCLYFVVLTYNSGATIGKRLLRIKVVSTDGEKLSLVDILYRETIGRFLCTVTMNMGYILVGIDKEKRGFHDMLSDTRVVYDFELKTTKQRKEKDKKEKDSSEAIVNTEQKIEKPVSMAPSNYGYVPGSQKNAAGNTCLETTLEEEHATEENAVETPNVIEDKVVEENTMEKNEIVEKYVEESKNE